MGLEGHRRVYRVYVAIRRSLLVNVRLVLILHVSLGIWFKVVSPGILVRCTELLTNYLLIFERGIILKLRRVSTALLDLVLGYFSTGSDVADTLVEINGACLRLRDGGWLKFPCWLLSDPNGRLWAMFIVDLYVLRFHSVLGNGLLNHYFFIIMWLLVVTAIKYWNLLVDNISVLIHILHGWVVDTTVQSSWSQGLA